MGAAGPRPGGFLCWRWHPRCDPRDDDAVCAGLPDPIPRSNPDPRACQAVSDWGKVPPGVAGLAGMALLHEPGLCAGRIAQLVEQLTLNQRVPGSSPGAPTNNPNSDAAFEAPRFRPGMAARYGSA